MTEHKKEIKISKLTLKSNIKLFSISFAIVFISMFVVSLFGKIDSSFSSTYSDLHNDQVFLLTYSGFLEDFYYGSGATAIYQDRNGQERYSIRENLFIEDCDTYELTFFHKLVLFYLPVVLFLNFKLLLFLVIIVFTIIKLKNKFNKKYAIKFE